MADSLSNLGARFAPFWEGFTPGQRVALTIVGLAALGLVAYVVAQGPEYAPVFTRLDDRDASAIVGKLRELNMNYRLADGGSTVLVPAGQVHEVRLQLAGEGLPQSGAVGFELFNQPNLGATEFSQKLNYQRALEGELARTIGRLSGVEHARVHLALPQPSLFMEQEKPATASVVLQLRPSVELTGEQIRGVTHLVATSVEGLSPENITVLDSRGRVLASGAGGGSLGSISSTGNQLELQRSYESHLARNVQDLLDRTLGPGKGMVSTSVLLDWESFEANNEIFSPNDVPAQVRSAREYVETTSTEGGAAEGGVPGVEANVAGVYQQVGANGNAQTERRETTQNFELSRSVERIVRLPGSVKRMTVSVVVDSAVEPEQIAQLERAIPAAVGMSPERGDLVEVVSIPFDRSFLEVDPTGLEEVQRQEQVSEMIELGRSLALPALGLLILGAMFMTLARRQVPVHQRLPAPASVVTEVVDDDLGVGDGRRRRALRDEIGGLARQQPQVVSQVIRTLAGGG